MFENIIAKGFNDEKTKEKSKRLSIIKIMENIDMSASEKLDSIDRLYLKLGWLPPKKAKEIQEKLENAHEYWNRSENDMAMSDALYAMLDRIEDALAILKGEK